MEVSTCLSTLFDYASKGETCPHKIGSCVIDSRSVLPCESMIHDYKAILPVDAYGYAKTVKAIQALHNSYGGFLFFGIKEIRKDIDYEISPLSEYDNFFSELRGKIKSYCSGDIGVIPIEIETELGTVLCIAVPKRFGQSPIEMKKESPQKKDGSHIFRKGEKFYRSNDEIRKAETTECYTHLLGPREEQRFFVGKRAVNLQSGRDSKIYHNIPSKDSICTDFIGREEILSSLWEWIGDDFSCVKVLAGDGGKGKTSIAHRFCQQLSISPPEKFTQIIWLSAKAKQFRAIDNSFFDLAEPSFDSSRSLLEVIASSTGLIDDETSDLDNQRLVRKLCESTQHFPSVIVVDDLDSLELDDQKRTIEYLQRFNADTVKFLVTTRVNHSLSSDTVITVEGLEEEAFESLARSLISKFSLSINPNRKQICKLHAKVGGSPLLAESVLRLVRMGYSLEQAGREWQGELGIDARRAVLAKEIADLTNLAKRALLAAAYLKSFSLTELSQVIETGKDKTADLLNELRSLFLVSGSSIIESEPRFEIPSLTAAIAIELHKELCLDHRRISKRANGVQPSKQDSKNVAKIGTIINQTIALLKQGESSKAEETARAGLKENPNNKDILFLVGRVLSDKNHTEACKYFKKAHKSGQDKEEFYELWNTSETLSGNYPASLEVCNRALELFASHTSLINWHRAKAHSLLKLALIRRKSNDKSGYVELTFQAAESIQLAVKYSDSEDQSEELDADVSDIVSSCILYAFNTNDPHAVSSALDGYKALNSNVVLSELARAAVEKLRSKHGKPTKLRS